MINSAITGFTGLDWLVLAGYFGLLVLTGILLTRKQTDTEDYFRARGSIPMWAAAVSFLATALSAATFIGGPQQSFKGDLTYLSANIGSIIAVFIVAFFFVPAFYRNRVATVYGLLKVKYGENASFAASIAFMIGRIFASGARLYIAALPASLIIFGDIAIKHQIIAIIVIAGVGILYTFLGGIRTVIWTDVIQTIIFTGAAFAALILLLDKIPLPVPDIIDALKNPGDGQTSKLAMFRLGFDGFSPKHTYTVLSAIFGFSLLNLGSYGTDQDMAQRMLTCKNSVKGGQSAIAAIFIGLPVTALFMLIGLLLYIFYARPDLMGSFAPGYAVEGSRKIFLEFILHEMPPGMTGLMMAGLFAAGLSSLNSAINAMSSSFINDVYKRLAPGRSEKHYLFTGRLGVIVAGVLLAVFAVGSVYWQAARPQTTLIDFALMVMVFAYSGLLGVFLAAIFTRRGSEISVVASLITGFLAVFLMQKFMASIIAFPWQMFLATLLAFGVCCLGSRQAQS